jgi:AcrR family transcriptional regulator
MMEINSLKAHPTLFGISDPDPIKERILQYALIRFLDAGFHSVSVDIFTSELNMSKKTFYRVFDSKNDLVRQLLLRVVTNIGSRVKELLETDRPFVEKIELLMSLLANQIRRLNKPLMQDLMRYLPSVWEEVQTLRRKRVLEVFANLIAQGKSSGHIRPEVNTRIFLLTFVGAVEAVLTPAVLAEEAFSGEEVVICILSTFFHGILTEEASKELRTRHIQST